MTFRQFEKWCNERAIDGRWGCRDALYCLNIYEKIKEYHFWKREKVWREKYRDQVMTEIITPIEKKIAETYKEKKMAIAKKCDRCKQFYEPYNIRNDADKINGFMMLNIDNHQKSFMHGPYDLCSSCSKELTDWFNNLTIFIMAVKENNDA